MQWDIQWGSIVAGSFYSLYVGATLSCCKSECVMLSNVILNEFFYSYSWCPIIVWPDIHSFVFHCPSHVLNLNLFFFLLLILRPFPPFLFPVFSLWFLSPSPFHLPCNYSLTNVWKLCLCYSSTLTAFFFSSSCSSLMCLPVIHDFVLIFLISDNCRWNPLT